MKHGFIQPPRFHIESIINKMVFEFLNTLKEYNSFNSLMKLYINRKDNSVKMFDFVDYMDKFFNDTFDDFVEINSKYEKIKFNNILEFYNLLIDRPVIISMNLYINCLNRSNYFSSNIITKIKQDLYLTYDYNGVFKIFYKPYEHIIDINSFAQNISNIIYGIKTIENSFLYVVDEFYIDTPNNKQLNLNNIYDDRILSNFYGADKNFNIKCKYHLYNASRILNSKQYKENKDLFENMLQLEVINSV